MSSDNASTIEIIDVVIEPPAGVTCEFCNNKPAHCLIGRLNAVDMCADCFADLVEACGEYEPKDRSDK